eukprot:04547.XXX_143312_139620_1 [CDS] Oithona nana genome sequencing.
MHTATSSGGAGGADKSRVGVVQGVHGSSASITSTSTSRRIPRSTSLGGDGKECKYEQDLEFSATSRQLNYRRAKEERQKKIKRLKQLQKIQQGQKRRTMKRKMTSWMTHDSFDEADEDEAA